MWVWLEEFLPILQLIIDLLVAIIAIYVSIKIARWQTNNERLFMSRPYLSAALYQMDFWVKANSRPLFIRQILQTAEFDEIQRQIENGDNNLLEFENYKYIRLYGDLVNTAINFVIEVSIDGKNPFLKHYYNWFRKNDEVFILIPPDIIKSNNVSDVVYRFNKIELSVTYFSIAQEKVTYRFTGYNSQDLDVKHSYKASYRGRKTFTQEFECENSRYYYVDKDLNPLNNSQPQTPPPEAADQPPIE